MGTFPCSLTRTGKRFGWSERSDAGHGAGAVTHGLIAVLSGDRGRGAGVGRRRDGETEMTGTRRNILTMPLADVQRLTAAINVLKTNGTYDNFTRRHMQAMQTATPAGSSRNVAHRGPAFLPWHRAGLLEFEAALQAIDRGIGGLPYWSWQDDTALNGGTPAKSPLWTANY